jgi:hypothetical protein
MEVTFCCSMQLEPSALNTTSKCWHVQYLCCKIKSLRDLRQERWNSYLLAQRNEEARGKQEKLIESSGREYKIESSEKE